MPNTPESEKPLTIDEQTLISSMMQGKSIEECATALGISEKTVRRWLARPHVAAALKEVRENVTEHVKKQIETLSTKAIQSLEALLDSKTAVAKLGAVKLILDRVAPEQAKSVAQQPAQDDTLISRDLMQYMSDEEVSQIETIVNLAQARKAQALADREKMERMRA